MAYRDPFQAHFEAQMAANFDTYKNQPATFRADYRETQKLAREKATELFKANATIRELRQQLKTADAKPG
ncbi:MAG: hypothetical protein R6V26_05155 [Roseovarius sp.]